MKAKQTCSQCAAPLPDRDTEGLQIITSSQDGTVHVWDAEKHAGGTRGSGAQEP
jgi:hypothetical protein